jgi:hypothetical protein
MFANPLDQLLALSANRKPRKGMRPMDRLFTTSGRRAGNTFKSSKKLNRRAAGMRDAFLTRSEREERARERRLRSLIESFGAGAR